MQITGEKLLPVTRQQAWDALNDPEMLKLCIPGCDAIIPSAEGFDVIVVAAVGPVRATFKGKIMLKDLRPPESYRLEFSGQGGAAGYGKGEAGVSLSAISAHETAMHYTAKASVGGKLAQIGSRLVDMAAQKMADDFFSAFTRELRAKYVGEDATLAAVDAPGLFGRFRAWLRRLFGGARSGTGPQA